MFSTEINRKLLLIYVQSLLQYYKIKDLLIVLMESVTKCVPQFANTYCTAHPTKIIENLCLNPECELTGQYCCIECINTHKQHKMEPLKQAVGKKYLKFLDEQLVEVLSLIKKFRDNFDNLVSEFEAKILQWYNPFPHSCEQIQCLTILDKKSARDEIKQANIIKNIIVQQLLEDTFISFKTSFQQKMTSKEQEMSLLKYQLLPQKFKFVKQTSHDLIIVSPGKTTIEKKSSQVSSNLAILNQPLTPSRKSIAFTINSQSPANHYILFGLANPEFYHKRQYAADLQKGLYAIYQASNKKNNAYSLHCEDDKYHYKQIVGWNFRAGDTIIIQLKIKSDIKEVIFKKKGKGDTFSMPLKLYNKCILYPVVGLYGSADKVSIENV